MKRALVIIFILFLVAIGGYIYFSHEEITLEKDTSLYEAIPVSSPFFFEFNSLRSFPFDNASVKELLNAGTCRSFILSLQKLDTLILNSDAVSRGVRNSPFILSFGFAGRDQLVPLIIKKVGSKNQKNSLDKLIHTYFSPEKFKYIKKDYGKHKIYEVRGEKDVLPLFYSFSEGLLLISTKSLLVEQALRQLATSGIISDTYFKEVNKTANAGEVSLYINHENCTRFLENIVTNRVADRTDEFGENIHSSPRIHVRKFKDYAEWSELDFSFSDDHIILSGISAADDSLNHFLSIFNGQQPVNTRADDILPQNTSFFCSYSFSDKDIFFEKLEKFFTHSGFYYKREERIKRFEKGLRTDLRDIFGQLVKDEIIVSTNTVPVDPANKVVFFICHTESRTNSEELLQNLLINYASHSGTGTDKFKSEFSVDNEVNFAIYRFPYPSFPGILLGIPFTMADAEYFTFYDNYIVFSNSLQGLESYLRSMILGATLNKDINYARFKQNCPGRSNINIFLDINKAFSIGGEIFDGELAEQLSERENNLRKYSKMSWQIQRNKDIYFNALAIAFDQNPREEAQTTWQSTIGSDIRIKPELVINHNDRLNREIILQDVTNTLHQVTNEGRIRWSIPLSGPVLSEIHQVDYYKNGRLQYLFNTKEKLFLIDRNGNNVAHFPVSLRSEATNGISVFDYNNNRDYRYFIAGEDKKIYVYDYEGKIVKGWIFGQTDHEVVTPVQHFRVAGKDYIVFKDKSRIYIQNRRGETRVSTKARFENSANPLVLSLEGTPKIVADDVKGKVYYIYFSGKYEEKKTSGFSKDHFFTVDDLDGNGIPDFIFVDGKELVVIDGNGKRRFRKKFENSIHSPPNIYTFTNNHKKVGIVDADGNNIYLFNSDGTLNKGFPLQGNTEFSIGRISENSDGLNLLTGSEGGKLYNYTLD